MPFSLQGEMVRSFLLFSFPLQVRMPGISECFCAGKGYGHLSPSGIRKSAAERGKRREGAVRKRGKE